MSNFVILDSKDRMAYIALGIAVIGVLLNTIKNSIDIYEKNNEKRIKGPQD